MIQNIIVTMTVAGCYLSPRAESGGDQIYLLTGYAVTELPAHFPSQVGIWKGGKT